MFRGEKISCALDIIFIALLTMIASLIGTLAGFGNIHNLPQTLLLAGIIHWFNDVWKLILFGEGIRWKLFLAFGIPGIFASFLGSSLSLDVSRDVLSRALGMSL